MRGWLCTALAALMLMLCLVPARLPGTVMAQEAMAFDGYHSYGEVVAALEGISMEMPEIAQMVTLGQTWEGRDIMALRLTDNPEDNEPGEPAVLIMGGHHGNELASTEVTLYILNFLTENYEDNIMVRRLVDSRDIWFVPLVNPDGRAYSMANADWTWRKNRRPIDADGDGVIDGIGVDLNRNYGHLWGELPGTSHDPADSNYCGLSAFSENETRAISELALTVNFSMSLSYHTYGEVIYHPWNNDIDVVSPKNEVLAALAGDMAELNGYVPMEGIDAYPTTGDSDDWLYADTDCLPFTIEMGTRHDIPVGELEALCARNLESTLYAIEMSDEPETALLPEWTFMVYMSSDADITLANEAFVDMNEMEAVGSTTDMNVIVLYDGTGTGDSKVYQINKDPGGYSSIIISSVLDDQGAIINQTTNELDMSDPAVLRNFVSWTRDNYPARKTFLDFWGHGDGVLREMVPDKGTGLKIQELNSALSGFGLDIVGFDTCSLGHFEIAAELAGVADIMIGSEAEEPMAGWDYSTSLGKLSTDPRMSPRSLAALIVSDYLASRTEDYLTLAAMDLWVFREKLLPALGEFVNVSMDFAYADFEEIWAARNLTSTFLFRQDAVDLFQYLENLDRPGISGPPLARSKQILGLRDDLIIRSGTSVRYPNSRAMAVYFPRLDDSISPAYSGLRFLNTGWRDYLAGTKQPSPRPFITPVAMRAANNTLGPYNVSATLTGIGPGPFLLYYRPASGTWQSSAMQLSGQNLTGEIPGHANGTLMEYYFLDSGSNITEPYEVKWGAEDYLNFTVSAVCDITITDIEMINTGNISAGDILQFRINCSNIGPEAATVDITMLANQTTGGEIISVVNICLMPRESKTISFNWTAKSGDWTIMALAYQSDVIDSNSSNQAAAMPLHVLGQVADDQGFFEKYMGIIVLLIAIWAASLLVIIYLLRKARARRRVGIARSMHAANEFLKEAEALGGDITNASLMMARAGAALAHNDFAECEKLVRKARESAMNSVSEKEPHQ